MAGALGIALLLDALFGEPGWLWDRAPHPAILMGRAVGWCDSRLNRGVARRLKGTVAAALLVLAALGLGAALGQFGPLVETALAAILLAQRSLVQHVRAVADALRLSLGDARRAVALIVGRDTSAMRRGDVARAAIESAAENLSDGVVAPALWFLVGGLPGLLTYKIINTADSMIGHRTARHTEFGWAAARLDDVLNLVPARLTAALIAARYGLLADWPAIVAEARAHRSPNAGWPEAAMARALGVALSGPRTYESVLQHFTFVNPGGARAIGAAEIDAACAALWQVWAVLLGIVLMWAVVLG